MAGETEHDQRFTLEGEAPADTAIGHVGDEAAWCWLGMTRQCAAVASPDLGPSLVATPPLCWPSGRNPIWRRSPHSHTEGGHRHD